MKLVDVNLLLYAVNRDAPLHDAAHAWLEDALSATETVAFAWAVLLAFVRLSTNRLVFAEPLSVEDAFRVVDAWLAQPCSAVVHPAERHASILRKLLDGIGTAGNLTTDAHLAAIALEHGAELYSSDRDFARFPGLRWRNPLVP